MEEKLNMIFEKILDIEEQLKIQMLMQEQKKVKNELDNSKRHLEDIDYSIQRLKEQKAEEMCVFRSTGKLKQVEEN